MSSRVSLNMLKEASRILHADWQQTRASWTDAKSLQFEKDYLEALHPLVSQAIHVADEINVLLAKVRSDCE